MALSTIDASIIRIDEIIQEKSLDEALDYLQDVLRTRKKANPEELEKLMIKEIDLSIEYLNRKHLKDDLSYYRNIMQHENGKTLEKVHKYLRDSIEAKFGQIKEGITGEVEVEDVDTVYLADDLMLLAFQSEEQWDNKDKLGPCIKFMVEAYEMILDVLRQNSTMLELYNSTAIHCMDFCLQNHRKNEFKKISDTLSKHLKHILTQKLDNLRNIPHPVFIEEQSCFDRILDLRMKALDYALKLDNWSDSLKIIKDIRDLDMHRKK
jgi:translation initiation factor 3 subunit A